MADIYLHHVLKDVRLGLSVAVSLGFADDAVVLKQEDVTVVTSGRCPYSWSPFPHLEGSLILERQVLKKKRNPFNHSEMKTDLSDWLS